MELVNIYEDDNTQVIMAKPLVDTFNKLLNLHYTLGQIDYEDFIHDSLDYLKWYFDLKGKRVITSSKVAIVTRDKPIETPSSYESIIDAILILGECFDMTEGDLTKGWKMDMEVLIKLYYRLQYQQECILHIYDETVNNVSGFIALDGEDSILLFPFFLNEKGNSWSID